MVKLLDNSRKRPDTEQTYRGVSRNAQSLKSLSYINLVCHGKRIGAGNFL